MIYWLDIQLDVRRFNHLIVENNSLSKKNGNKNAFLINLLLNHASNVICFPSCLKLNCLKNVEKKRLCALIEIVVSFVKLFLLTVYLANGLKNVI